MAITIMGLIHATSVPQSVLLVRRTVLVQPVRVITPSRMGCANVLTPSTYLVAHVSIIIHALMGTTTMVSTTV